jgi:hypothetical protein
MYRNADAARKARAPRKTHPLLQAKNDDLTARIAVRVAKVVSIKDLPVRERYQRVRVWLSEEALI